MITWILTAISLAGNILNCVKIRACFIVWVICNTGWILYDAQTGLWSRMTLDIVQTILCIFGFISWGRYDKKYIDTQNYHDTPGKHKEP